jgi:hypothetical protein
MRCTQVNRHGQQCIYRTRKAIIDETSILSDTILADYAKRPCVSLVIDAGTIERRPFLDLMILAPYRGLRPFTYDSLENERLTADDHGQFVAQTIEKLRTQGVEVLSIVGDNLPAQVSALAHWSPKSRLRGTNALLNGIKYSPCLCHFMQLIVGDCISRVPGLQEADEIFQDLITLANSSDFCKITRRRCPQFVKTRWSSRCEALH